jgi:predicted GIY-YIG superfamily endonuclease
MYYVYILASRRHGTLYIGVTNSLQKRLEEHRNGEGSSFVKPTACTAWFTSRRLSGPLRRSQGKSN